MKKGMNARLALLTAALLLAIGWVLFSFQQGLSPASAPATLTKASERKTVEEFALPDENGRVAHLSDYKGQIVALVFYASW